MSNKTKKQLLLNLPYFIAGLVCTNLGEAWRIAEGADMSEKLLGFLSALGAAFSNPMPSLHPMDLLIGVCCGAGLRLAVYLKGKNAKKYRHGMEYGSARWGTQKDIEPFEDPVFANNVILTRTERLMMGNRPKNPANARNKNVLVVGGSGSGKTLKSIQITLVSRLEKFNLESLAGMTQTDEMELWSLGEKKTAIFAVIPDNDSSFNFIVGMLYTQLFQQLYYQADVVHGGRLPVHVHFVMDEFANVALPDEFDKLLATMRSREISVSIIIQNLAQLKALFEKQWESIVGNCDEFLYLGGNEQSTHEYVSKLLGKETIDTNTYGQSKGRSGSYSTNWQLTGRELLMPDEVRMLDNQYALLFVRGERPVRDLKYDILKHPNIKLTTDGGAEPYRHGEDTHSIVSIRFDKELLKQAVEKDGQDAPKHRFILLTEEELEQKFIELEEQENAEQQKGNEAAPHAR